MREDAALKFILVRCNGYINLNSWRISVGGWAIIIDGYTS